MDAALFANLRAGFMKGLPGLVARLLCTPGASTPPWPTPTPRACSPSSAWCCASAVGSGAGSIALDSRASSGTRLEGVASHTLMVIDAA
jgi:hypothetical protein